MGRLRVESVAERLEMADLLGSKYFKAQGLGLRVYDIATIILVAVTSMVQGWV